MESIHLKKLYLDLPKLGISISLRIYVYPQHQNTYCK